MNKVTLVQPLFYLIAPIGKDAIKLSPRDQTVDVRDTTQLALPGDTGELIALQDNDPIATREFVLRHISWMLVLARRILRDDGHAEDAVQSAFASIFKDIDNFAGRSALKTWMHRIVVNEALMLRRKKLRLNEKSIDDLLPEFDGNGCRLEQSWATFETPETLLQRSEMRARITVFIDLLPDQYRIVVILRDIEEISTAEVAKALGLSEVNVKVRLHRARAALKKLLEPTIREIMP
jgi:RNA polymerase sigma-70 factor (ECF subfamily)